MDRDGLGAVPYGMDVVHLGHGRLYNALRADARKA